MKQLLIILLLFIGVKGMGQTNSGIAIFGYDTIPSTPDTVRVIMLVCDTAYKKSMGTYWKIKYNVDHPTFKMDGDSSEDVGPFYNVLPDTWWQFGYDILEQYGDLYTSFGRSWIHKEFLDSDKKPLSKKIYVFMSNILNK